MFPLKMVILHCYVSSPEGNSDELMYYDVLMYGFLFFLRTHGYCSGKSHRKWPSLQRRFCSFAIQSHPENEASLAPQTLLDFLKIGWLKSSKVWKPTGKTNWKQLKPTESAFVCFKKNVQPQTMNILKILRTSEHRCLASGPQDASGCLRRKMEVFHPRPQWWLPVQLGTFAWSDSGPPL